MKKLQHKVQYFQTHLPHLQKVLRNTLLLLSITTLIFCRDISEYTSGGDRDIWFYHFTIVERVSMLFLLLSVFKYIKEISWIVGELLFLFLAQDIIDRSIFNYKEVNINDYITIGLLIIIAIIKWQQHKKK